MAASSVSGECGSADPFARDACVPPTHPVERGTRFERLRTSQRRSKTDPRPIQNRSSTPASPKDILEPVPLGSTLEPAPREHLSPRSPPPRCIPRPPDAYLRTRACPSDASRNSTSMSPVLPATETREPVPPEHSRACPPMHTHTD
jgi:hypothetical protein